MIHCAERSIELSVPVAKSRQGELTLHRPSLRALTGIRFFAAMYVVLFHSHLSDVLDQHHLFAGANLVRNGLLAVPLFFILSGFILSYTYQGQITRPLGKRRFWEARFARVWPLYIVSLLVSSVFTHTTPSSLFPAIATLFMIQAWNPFDMGMAGTWNFVCWTLSTEALFYLVFPFLQIWLEQRRLWLLGLALSIALAVAIIFQTGGINYEDTRGIWGVPLAGVHLPEFVVGVCVGNLFLRLRNAGRRITKLAQSRWFGYGVATYIATIASLWLLCHSRRAVTTWTVLSFAVLLFCLAAERSALNWLLSTRVLLIGGQISFGMYLLQWPCKMAVNRLCDWANLRSMPERFIVDCIALLLVSALGFYTVEEPGRQVIRSFFSRTYLLRSREQQSV